MKHSLKNLSGYSVTTQDGTEGKIKDFLFDEKRWIVRYLEVDFGSFFNMKKALIPRSFLENPDPDNENIKLALKGKDIEACPDLDQGIPVSRAYETELNKYYNIDHYWMVDPAAVEVPVLYPPRPLGIPGKTVSEDDLDTSLRSFKEVEGYHINALDGQLGHIDDIITDEYDWQIVHIIADTSNWLPWSKKVILPLDFLDKISYVKQEVSISLKKDTIKNAPEFDPHRPLELKEEKTAYDFMSSIMMDK
ncbi:MAG: PRC-barrel domain-containing protein [Bacteroidales bacterium]|jgi:uncharacterized protein YrrD|nr:PRC-barrel domain-containing protein [Bacteroidales bacterium]